MFRTSLDRSQHRFEVVVANLEADGKLLDETANAINIAETRQKMAMLEQHRKEQLEAVEREENDQASRQYQEIVAWLKFDESEQVLILDYVSEESRRFPGGCDWILKNDNMRTWLQRTPSTPVVCLQGKLGSGKSVLAAGIISFLHSAKHSLVVYHFCDSSRPSSMTHGGILRSLLLQLIKGNPDLIAYICSFIHTKPAESSVTPQSLEVLLRDLAQAVSKSPDGTQYVHIIIDGLSECEAGTQKRVAALLGQLAVAPGPSTSVVYKLFLLARTSDVFARRLRKKAIISLAEQATHVEMAIQSYAGQRLRLLCPRILRLGFDDAEVKSLAAAMAKKADGRFHN